MKRICILLLCTWAIACDARKGAANDELTIVVQGDRRELAEEERAIQAREEALRQQQGQLDARIEELAKTRAAADAAQRKLLDEELSRIRAQKGEIVQRTVQAEAQRNEVAAKRTALEAPAQQQGPESLLAREAQVASREARLFDQGRDLAVREKAIAEREHEVAERERADAAKELELAAREGKVSSLEASREPLPDRGLRDLPRAAAVEARHKKVLSDIEARGILITDLPPEDQPVNAEIYAARKTGDLARAWDLTGELGKVVARLKIDQRFVEQKMGRLQTLRGRSKLEGAPRAEVEKLLREVTAAYSDGHYVEANKGLNRIAVLLDAGAAPG